MDQSRSLHYTLERTTRSHSISSVNRPGEASAYKRRKVLEDASHGLPALGGWCWLCVSGWMCLPTVVLEIGFVGVVICTFYDFIFLDHFSLILNSIVFLMVASNFVFYAASVSVGSPS